MGQTSTLAAYMDEQAGAAVSLARLHMTLVMHDAMAGVDAQDEHVEDVRRVCAAVDEVNARLSARCVGREKTRSLGVSSGPSM